MRSRWLLLACAAAWLACAAACGPLPKQGDDEPKPVGARIVTTERGPRGGRLVAVREDGTRIADITRSSGDVAVDQHPAFSRDGRYLVFASTRGRGLSETSLWMVRSESASDPVRLTRGPAIDRDPVWTPDGRGIVYASNAGGSFDLWVVPVRWEKGAPQPAAEPRQLSTENTHELGPAVSPDGTTVVYMVLDPRTGKSTLWVRPLAGGAATRLTEGPADITPMWRPDGKAIAFAAPVPERGDTDIYSVPAGGGERSLLAAEPLADQTGPVYSGDARFLFATSVFRSEVDRAPILASLTVLELGSGKREWRALHDPVAVDTRVGVAVAGSGLDRALLRKNLAYRDALKRALRRHQLEREGQRPKGDGAPKP